MLIVGERINTSRKAVNEAVEKRDADYVRADVRKQAQAGAHYIDVNAGSRIGSEREDLNWLIQVIESAVEIPLALDSPDPSGLPLKTLEFCAVVGDDRFVKCHVLASVRPDDLVTRRAGFVH